MTLALILALALAPGAAPAAGPAAGAPAAVSAPARLGQVRDEIKSRRKDLAETQRAMDQERRTLREAQRQEGSLLVQLEGLDRDMALAKRDLATHNRNLALVQDRLAAIRALLDRDRQSLEANRAALARRLQAMHRHGGMDTLAMLLDARKPAELMSRLQFLRSLARSNASLMEQASAEIARVQAYEQEYADKERELKGLQASAEDARRKVAEQQRRRKDMLKGLRRQKQRSARTLEELRRAAEGLQGLMGSLEGEAKRLEAAEAAAERAQRAARLAASGGTLLKRQSGGGNLWPVEGRLVSRYGKQRHPQFGTWVFNRGIEIAAPEGTPIRSVAAGRVLFADWFTGFGQMAVVDHGGGYYTLYAHAATLNAEKGATVQAGDVLGTVGDSGSLGEPTLYFEVRQNGKAIDPAKWLAARSKAKSRKTVPPNSKTKKTKKKRS